MDNEKKFNLILICSGMSLLMQGISYIRSTLTLWNVKKMLNSLNNKPFIR